MRSCKTDQSFKTFISIAAAIIQTQRTSTTPRPVVYYIAENDRVILWEPPGAWRPSPLSRRRHLATGPLLNLPPTHGDRGIAPAIWCLAGGNRALGDALVEGFRQAGIDTPNALSQNLAHVGQQICSLGREFDHKAAILRHKILKQSIAVSLFGGEVVIE